MSVYIVFNVEIFVSIVLVFYNLIIDIRCLVNILVFSIYLLLGYEGRVSDFEIIWIIKNINNIEDIICRLKIFIFVRDNDRVRNFIIIFYIEIF